MQQKNSYRLALLAAMLLHLGIACFLIAESHHSVAVLTQEKTTEQGHMLAQQTQDTHQPEIIKAVTVDSQDVLAAVSELKQARLQQQQAAEAKKATLAKQALLIQKNRLQAELALTKLKQETAKIALEHKQRMLQEQQHLKQLTEQKVQETLALEQLKHDQALLVEKNRQAAEKKLLLKKKLIQAQAQTQKLKIDAAETLAKQPSAGVEAAENAAKKAKISGEVNRYKAMIINAISERWILPDNVDNHLSSQFQIRLAADGSVLDVHLIKSSGDAILDRSAQTAIYKASPLPVPADPVMFDMFKNISLTVRPENIRS